MMSRIDVPMAADTSSSGWKLETTLPASACSAHRCLLDSASEIIKGLASVPAPGKVFIDRVDPVLARHVLRNGVAMYLQLKQ